MTAGRRADCARASPNLSAPTLFLAGSVAGPAAPSTPTDAEALEKLVLAGSARARGSAEHRRIAGGAGQPGQRGGAAAAPGGAGRRRSRRCAPRGRAPCAWFPTAEADRLLAATLRGDHDPTVRAAAVFAAGFRKLGPLVDALVETAENDPIDYVRSGAVTLLAHKRRSIQVADRQVAAHALPDRVLADGAPGCGPSLAKEIA